MEKSKAIITGRDIESFVKLFKKAYAEDKRRFYWHSYGSYSRTYDKVYVFCKEKFYLRTMSNLMSTVILELVEKNKCTLDIITGGGSSGVFSIDFGAEVSRNLDIHQMVLDIAAEHDWDVVIK